MVIPKFTKEDFLDTTKPFEEIDKSSTPFEKEQKKTKISEMAREVGVKNFGTLYKQYSKTMNILKDCVENASDFDGQELELNTGTWMADEYGVSRSGYGGQEENACPHPIMPVLRLENVDTGLEKTKLAFKKGGIWRDTVCDRKTMASKNLIVSLADYGISVTSENAKYLVQYLSDVENINYDRIPAKKSVSRLGWVGDDGFSPYVEGLVFDGENSYKSFFESVTTKGRESSWMKAANDIRENGTLISKVVLAASFASVLVEPCSCLPFFVHLWGGTETGKTVGLMLAASVWANPEMGKYIHTFNSTAVAQELSASFVNSMPLILDELQIVKDRKDFDQMIYQLSEGIGKSRGEKTGGLRKVGTWNNCIITTGEQPITSSSSGGGAVNRIIELCCEDEKIFKDPVHLVKVVKNNYGYAGKRFIEILSDENIMNEAKSAQHDFYEIFNKSEDEDEKNATEKQSLAASLILTADWVTAKYLFKDNNTINPYDLMQYLATKASTDQNVRAYEWLSNWIAQNKAKFSESGKENEYTLNEIYGEIGEDYVEILNNVFCSACSDAGFNPTSFKKWLLRKGKTEGNYKKDGTQEPTKTCMINGVKNNRCVRLIVEDSMDFVEVNDQIDF